MTALPGKRTAEHGLSRLLDRKKKSGLATVNGERRQSRRLPVSLTSSAKEAAIC
jgi:hypothetical protein